MNLNLTFNKYWIFIAVIIILNIIVFSVMTSNLESYVYTSAYQKDYLNEY